MCRGKSHNRCSNLSFPVRTAGSSAPHLRFYLRQPCYTRRMTNVQRLTMRASEIRQRLNECAGLTGDALTTEIRSEVDTLTAEYSDTETKLRAAIVADDGTQHRGAADDAEARALADLTGRASIGRIVSGVVERRAVDGADLELQQHHGLPENTIPLDMLRAPAGEVERRDVTPTPANAGAMQDAPIAPVFAAGSGAFLGIDRPTVAYGSAVYPVLTTRPTVHGPVATSADAADTTGGFGALLLPPERLQASFVYRRSDAARFEGMDESLRAALSLGLEEALDADAISGTNGLLTATNLPNHNVSTATTFSLFVSQFSAGRVDGRYAAMQTDVRTVMGAGSYAHAAASYQSTPHQSALDVLAAKTGGVRVSAHVPAVASHKQNSVVRLGMRRDMVQPLWQGLTIIVDEVSKSGAGEIEITAVMLMNTRILRAAGFYKQQIQTQ